MKKHLFIAAVAASALCKVDIATAVLFEDNFEGATSVNSAAFPGTGDFDPDSPATGSWFMQEDISEGVQVSSFTGSGQPTAAHSGNNYLIAGFHNAYYGDWNHKGLATANLASTVNAAAIDFWVWGQSDIVGAVDGKELDFADGATAFDMQFWGGGEVKFNAGGGLTALVATMTDNAWNHIVIDLDLVNDTADVTVNSQPTESFAATATETLGSVRFRDDNTGYYDDVMISIPEPATLGMLLAMSAGILWIRRTFMM